MPKSPHSPLYRRFLRAIKQARQDSGLTQVEVAEKIGRPQSFISNCESGERRIDVAEFVYLCSVYGVEPTQVLGEMQEHRTKK